MVSDANPQPPKCERRAVLLPTALDRAFDYLVPEGTPEGTLVEATLGSRKMIGVALEPRTPNPELRITNLKHIIRAIESVPPLSPAMLRWLDWVAEFTLAPRGAVLSLCALQNAAKIPRKPLPPQHFTSALPTLSESQQHVLGKLEQHFFAPRQNSGHKLKPVLLDGVTGSGKTEIYFHLIAETILEQSRHVMTAVSTTDAKGDSTTNSPEQLPQVLVLLPEIGLTHQWLERFERVFGAPPIVWHSGMTPAARAKAWQAVARGQVQVVVGARSALFLPFVNLRLIVIDEEHDPSYKQGDGVLYHARDMAVARGHIEQIPTLLVSATPALETLENVAERKYEVVRLPHRFGTAGLPSVRLIDLRIDSPARGEFLSPTVKHAALETLNRGEQVLFFLNRRGYAPLLLCRACGHRFQCSECSAWLVMHGKGKGASLHCHHCGHKEKFPHACPACHAEAEMLVPCGPGVERVAEEVRGWFVEAPRLALLSSDEAVAPETWAAIERGEVDILVGTQMVAKGHHFPRLTLVVVVDADAGLEGTDLRAGERTYQLLHQLGGRAGREKLSGSVMVQSFTPDHPVMKALVAHDRDRLMALEAHERKAGGWPPFGGLAAILLDGKEEAAVRAAGQTLARTAPTDPRLRVLGPAPAPLSKLRGQYRYRLLVKSQPGIHLQRTLRAWLTGVKFKGVRVKVDVNPYYFM